MLTTGWRFRRSQPVAVERGTLYGLPVYADRRVHYGPIDPKLSRAAAPAQRFAATDRALIINVLARARSCLLLPDVPLELGNAFIARTLWSDDPRLVALARQTGVEEIP